MPRPRLILVAVLTPSTPPLRSGVGSALTGLRATTRGTYRGTARRAWRLGTGTVAQAIRRVLVR
jgi:hypothetical protein